MRWHADTVAVSSMAWMLASTQCAGLVSWAPVSWSVTVTSQSGRPSNDVPYCSTVTSPGLASATPCSHDVNSS